MGSIYIDFNLQNNTISFTHTNIQKAPSTAARKRSSYYHAITKVVVDFIQICIAHVNMESEKINTHLSNNTIHPTLPARRRIISSSKSGRMVKENVFDTLCMMNLFDTMNMIFSLHADVEKEQNRQACVVL